MPLTVLGETDVHNLLLSLTRDEVLELQKNLGDALREYSTGNQEAGCCSEYQPQRTAITRNNGLTTIFMPASTGSSIGLKILSVPDIPVEPFPTVEPEPSSSHRPSIPSILESRTSVDSTLSKLSSLSLPSTTDSSSVSDATTAATLTSPPGNLTLLDTAGKPTALLNARELTSFRTALASLILFNKRKHVHTITVFGAGLQAYWHIRLALILRGSEIKHVNIINRSFERATNLFREFYSAVNSKWRLDVKFSTFSPDFVEYERLLHEGVRKADAIFCCTPALEPLFPGELLTAGDGRRKGRYISAIGSVTPFMTELDPKVLLDAVEPHHHHRLPHHRHPTRGGAVIVDSLDSCMRDAGEIVQAKLNAKQLVEIGELMMLKAERVKERGREYGEGDGEIGKDDKALLEWIRKGNVIYKSVGLGLMDLVVGGDLVALATDRGVGTRIEDF
ncbi:hypothetical protein FQN53_004526 [Emmonsiellopsis sp. PD_33]|nr:hypothetical protein FQN53_004526 [Emmonsiellopsis sp. PD_33]